MNTILNIISVVSSFIFGVGILYWIMDITIGRIKIINTTKEWNGLQSKDFIFLLLSILIIFTLVDFYKPYSN